jgi:hypothetical protein
VTALDRLRQEAERDAVLGPLVPALLPYVAPLLGNDEAVIQLLDHLTACWLRVRHGDDHA